MNILGVRCSNKDFAYAVMTGTQAEPAVVVVDTLAFPKNFARPRSLHWCMQEIEQLIGKHTIEAIVIKRFEGRSRGGTFEDRVEYEAAVYLAAAKSAVTNACKKMKSTIAKDLGLKGRARYLETGLDTSVIPGFGDYTDKEQEAVLSAWSALP